jgi:hypothetical protein
MGSEKKNWIPYKYTNLTDIFEGTINWISRFKLPRNLTSFFLKIQRTLLFSNPKKDGRFEQKIRECLRPV